MEHGVLSLFLVASFDTGTNSGAIYEVKLRGGGGSSELATISPLVKVFSCPDGRGYSPVGCDILGSHMCLMASYRPIEEYRFIQLQPLLFNTNTKEIFELPKPNAIKPFPKVMAVHGSGFFVLAGGTICQGIDIDHPCFERFDPPYKKEWDSSSLPEFNLKKNSFMNVVGYAVVKNCILISVVDVCSIHITEFHCYQVGSSMKEWQVVNKENEDEFYYSFGGKAEYVDEYVYTIAHDFLLIAYRVTISAEDVIQYIGVPLKITGLKLVDLPKDCYEPLSCCLVHLGGKIFCLVKSGFPFPGEKQYVSMLIGKVSDDMNLSTLSSFLFTLNVEGHLGASLTSLCFDSQRNKFDCKSEFWTRGLKVWSEQCEDLYVDTHMQPVNIEPEGSQPARKRVVSSASVSGKRIKVESVDGFLQLLGLEEYSIIFEFEEIDMGILLHMTDEDLKALGLPEVPRKQILSALESDI